MKVSISMPKGLVESVDALSGDGGRSAKICEYVAKGIKAEVSKP